MNELAHKIEDAEAEPTQPLNLDLLRQGSEEIRPYFQKLETLAAAIEAQATEADPGMAKKLRALARKVLSFEASVTLIGQVKAGKTALTNVLSGNVDLLPSDVNPWTSVVTSLHMNSKVANPKTKAQFKFFSTDEWDKLVKGGGRLGELAGRAGADEDIERLRRQIEEMRQTARERLSGSFEALLGKTHKYGYVDRELIERYVCLGDPDEIELNPKSQQGRFSDITRAADIWLDLPQLGGAYVIRDTPGVNDTFMVREQITIRALRQSKLCVVVLSAHEALNTTDLALVRLISNYRNRQVILFVNRIDELERPSEQIPEIRDSIQSTLKQFRALREHCVLFGSARWAEAALRGNYDDFDDDAEVALADWRSARCPDADGDEHETVWELSGIPDLMRALNERMIEGPGLRHLRLVRTKLQNIKSEIAAQEALNASKRLADRLAEIDTMALRRDLGALTRQARARVDDVVAELDSTFATSLDRVQDDYVTRAIDALVEHLKEQRAGDTWTFNSAGLRLVLRTTYDRLAAQAKADVEQVYQASAAALSEIYLDRLGLDIDGFQIEPPQVPKMPPPVEFGKTIAVDLGSTWWKRWWLRRRSLKARTDDYRGLIADEIATMINDLRERQLAEVFVEMRDILAEFHSEQTETILGLLRRAAEYSDADDPAAMGVKPFNDSLRDALQDLPSHDGTDDHEGHTTQTAEEAAP